MENKLLFLTDFIDQRKQVNQQRHLRTLIISDQAEVQYNGRTLINFCSNNYLGLANHPLLKQRAIDYINQYGTGATASRLVCGNFHFHEEVEAKIATLMQYESALLFNSGYQANLTLLPALADRYSLILADKHNHHSLLQGAKASGAKVVRYRHNDLNHLEFLLQNAAQGPYTRKWIVTESIFSMDGDSSDLDALAVLSKKYSALLYVDDAHATGIAGVNGMGHTSHRSGMDIAVGVFGKAGGASGAFAACSKLMHTYLIQCCAGIIYSTALPPSIVGAIDGALEIIPQLETERKKLHENITSLRNTLQQLGFNTGASTTHIIPLMMKTEMQALALATWLEQNGILAIAIRPPTVPAGCSCVRISLSAMHTQQHLDQLLTALQKWVA
jgi:8-amino-7-oxononanoate synthase